jgi:hypothetical protein
MYQSKYLNLCHFCICSIFALICQVRRSKLTSLALKPNCRRSYVVYFFLEYLFLIFLNFTQDIKMRFFYLHFISLRKSPALAPPCFYNRYRPPEGGRTRGNEVWSSFTVPVHILIPPSPDVKQTATSDENVLFGSAL